MYSITSAENAVFGTFSALHLLRNCSILTPMSSLCNYDPYLFLQNHDCGDWNNVSKYSMFSPGTEYFAISQSTSSFSNDIFQLPLVAKLPSSMETITVRSMQNSLTTAPKGTLNGQQFDYASSSNLNIHRRTRTEKRSIPEHRKDEKYYERRKRNNQAAKKSRDARKVREDQIALRARMLEYENALLKAQIIALQDEAQSLRHLLVKQQTPGIRNLGGSNSIPTASMNTITSAISSLVTLNP